VISSLGLESGRISGQTFNNPTPALAANFPAGLHWKRYRAASCSFKMISFSNINKQYGKQLLFVDASFQLNPGEKVGLVGPNEVNDRLLSPGRHTRLWVLICGLP
jgi:ABC-type multidrug transport system fused ATPase/permease subunit